MGVTAAHIGKQKWRILAILLKIIATGIHFLLGCCGCRAGQTAQILAV